MIKNGISIKGAKAIILGVTFKENCPDIRNSKVIDIENELSQFGIDVSIYDPHADASEVKREYNIELVQHLVKYDVIILAVAHDSFLDIEINDLKLCQNSIVFDLKGVLDKSKVNARL